MSDVLEQLAEILEHRREGDPQESYVASLHDKSEAAFNEENKMKSHGHDFIEHCKCAVVAGRVNRALASTDSVSGRLDSDQAWLKQLHPADELFGVIRLHKSAFESPCWR